MGKIDWGLIGVGEGSQIGFSHRVGALEGNINFVAGALDVAGELDITAFDYPVAEATLRTMQILYSMTTSVQNGTQRSKYNDNFYRIPDIRRTTAVSAAFNRF